MKNKKGDLPQQHLVYIIILVMVISLFLLAVNTKADSRGIKKQVLETQLALMIDSAMPETNLTVKKQYISGYVNDILIKESRIYVSVDGLKSLDGYPLITQYKVYVIELDDKFIIEVKDE